MTVKKNIDHFTHINSGVRPCLCDCHHIQNITTLIQTKTKDHCNNVKNCSQFILPEWVTFSIVILDKYTCAVTL